MKKCIVIPDSYKGTISSADAAQIMKEEIHRVYPACEVIKVPISDGGEGLVDCLMKPLDGEIIKTKVRGPFGDYIQSFYGRSGETAVIEMAAAAGLHLAEGRLNPAKASTYGVGELIHNAVDNGCTDIIIGLGGSCTNDGGAGMAMALGTRFLNRDGQEFLPTGDTLKEVVQIDNRPTRDFLQGVSIRAMCDIDNPMFGQHGAAFVFAPQKGADEKMVEILDENLRAFALTIKDQLGIDVSNLRGAGAAGAMGAGVVAFLGGTLGSGIGAILDIVGFDSLLQGCDWVFTGEGKLDSQSLDGKAIGGIGNRAKKYSVPVIAVVGIKEGNVDEIYNKGVCKVYETSKKIEYAGDYKMQLRQTMRDIVR
ncbi:MAG: glycerate kinase [Bacillota bacterium]|nr:glycerate kinase [Bacillota bacterium]